MPRPTFRTLLLALLLAALPCPVPVFATDAPADAWRERLDSARHEVEAAHQRVEAARSTYQDWRQRKYPRGVRKEELVREVGEAEKAAREAEAKMEALLEQARRDGVLPGVLRDYE